MTDNNTIRKKSIGLFAAISIGVGGMIGAGIFSILGVAGQIAGSAVYISFTIAGVVALLCAYSYAKLGSTYPSAGGPVEFLIQGLGNNILSGGFNILMWIAYIFALALYAKAFGSYAMTFLPPAMSNTWINIFATSIIIVFTLVNYIGAKAVGRSELTIVIIKVVILVVFATFGLFNARPSLLRPSQGTSITNILFCAGIVFLAYEGFGLITNAGEDMHDPKRLIPKALYYSIALAMVIYVSVCLAVIGNLPIPKIIQAKDYALAEAAKPFLGLIGFKIIAIAALFSTSSAINATLYGGANVSYVVAKEGELPRFFERKMWGRSSEGLFITSALVIIAANFLNLEGITMLGSASFLLIYTAVNFAHLRLLKQTGAKSSIVWLSILGCIISFIVLAYYEVLHSVMTLVILAVVVAFSFAAEWVYRRSSGRVLKARVSKVSKKGKSSLREPRN
jgi:amino acid transporter